MAEAEYLYTIEVVTSGLDAGVIYVTSEDLEKGQLPPDVQNLFDGLPPDASSEFLGFLVSLRADETGKYGPIGYEYEVAGDETAVTSVTLQSRADITTLPPGAEFGKSYPTPGGDTVLQRKNVEAVIKKLKPIPSSIATTQPGYAPDMRARPQVVAALQTWRENALSICEGKATPRETPKVAKLRISSAYRVLGTTTKGKGGEDMFGALDSIDKYGHWSGFAVDAPTKLFREECVPALTKRECCIASINAGLTRPWYDCNQLTIEEEGCGEYWHYRPEDESLPSPAAVDV
jgi:hypothetical protein